ncbi:MAG: type II toxin-antitoxin system RelE/ParE family toxin [Sphingomicrobium sp.]
MSDGDKPLVWIGSTLKDLRAFPEEVKDVMGFALREAQAGGKHPDSKPLKGNKGAGVLEVVDDFDGDTYRAVYTVKLQGVVYCLHAFQKKSKTGKATDKTDLDMIERRLKLARDDHERRKRESENG